MSTIQSIELFTAINLAVVGLSHFIQAKAWVNYFVFLHSKKRYWKYCKCITCTGGRLIYFILSFCLVLAESACNNFLFITGYKGANLFAHTVNRHIKHFESYC